MPSYEKKSDFHLWKSFKKGDKLALDVIFKRHYSALHRYGVKLTNNVTLTEDCLQDFFLYIYEHRQNLKDLDAIKPYLFKAFRNRLLKYLKANTDLVSINTIEKDGLPMSFSIEELMIQRESKQLRRKQIVALLNRLTDKQKELIYLKYYNNLSISDISEIVGISYQGVLNGLSKCMKKLKKLYADTYILSLIYVFLIFF